jgi:hypothetical protein
LVVGGIQIYFVSANKTNYVLCCTKKYINEYNCTAARINGPGAFIIAAMSINLKVPVDL